VNDIEVLAETDKTATVAFKSRPWVLYHVELNEHYWLTGLRIESPAGIKTTDVRVPVQEILRAIARNRLKSGRVQADGEA
jgi:hypothetical protein